MKFYNKHGESHPTVIGALAENALIYIHEANEKRQKDILDNVFSRMEREISRTIIYGLSNSQYNEMLAKILDQINRHPRTDIYVDAPRIYFRAIERFDERISPFKGMTNITKEE